MMNLTQIANMHPLIIIAFLLSTFSLKIRSFDLPVIASTATVATTAGYLGKRFINGPLFNEPVSLIGKNVIITGANSGLGRETALKLASFGATTILLCKDKNKGISTATEIKEKTKNNRVYAIQVDLSDLESINKATLSIKQSFDNIHILVNNAGIMSLPERLETKDGFEAQIGVNHLGHFALTGLLFDLILKNDPLNPGFKRVVNLASQAHLFGNIDRDNLMLNRPGSYKPWPAYGNSKLCNILFTRELAKRLQKAETSIGVFCCHPGLCRTDLGRYSFDMEGLKKLPEPLLKTISAPIIYFTKSPEQGAQTQIFLSASDKLSLSDSGKYFDNSAASEPGPKALNDDLAYWLFEESERLTGVKFKV